MFMKKLNQIPVLLAAFAVMFFLAPQAEAQLHVAPTGEVGIGTTTNTTSKLHIYNSNSEYRGIYNYTNYNGSSWIYGMYNYASGSGTGGRYGLYSYSYSPTSSNSSHRGMYNYSYLGSNTTNYGFYNYANAASGTATRYGLYNYLYCGSNTGTKYALYSSVSCGGNYAGYFNGNLYVAGAVTQTSDASKKTNVEELNNATTLIKALAPKTYDYIEDADLALPTEKQYGFLAQELEKVLPELVQTVDVPGSPIVDETGENPEMEGETEGSTIKSVNYMALIPILVKALQEQEVRIADLEKQLENR